MIRFLKFSQSTPTAHPCDGEDNGGCAQICKKSGYRAVCSCKVFCKTDDAWNHKQYTIAQILITNDALCDPVCKGDTFP